MKTTLFGLVVLVAPVFAVLGGRSSSAQDKQDRYTLRVPGGLAFSEIKGYEQWQMVGPTLAASKDYIFTDYPKR